MPTVHVLMPSYAVQYLPYMLVPSSVEVAHYMPCKKKKKR